MPKQAYVIGAGLAGLSAALSLTATGCKVTLFEAAPAAGGRCRSYFDRSLGLAIDNGNHLLLSGNHAAMGYLEEIGATDALGGPTEPVFPFIDPRRGECWTLRINSGRFPWWVFARGRRVPGTRLPDYLPLIAFPRITDDRSVTQAVPRSLLSERLLQPLAVAVLNTPPDQGLARLLGQVVRETMMRGGNACLPRFPRQSLAAAFVDPALATLQARGADIRFGCRIAAIDISANRITDLVAPDTREPVTGPVILAVPPWVASDLLPGLIVPDEFQAILNIHFRIDADPGLAGFWGVIGGTAEWIFVKPGHVSVTISAANRMVDQPAEEIAQAVWPDVRLTLGLDELIPPWRVVKEKRATFAATAAQERRRPGPRTDFDNLVLAGDWTATGLPATIEGAIRSGRRAAEMVFR
jgi:squalene-associated FAD-dependent desaturase